MTAWKRREVIGNATLYLGDCFEWLSNVPACFCVDRVVTDPPYGIRGAASSLASGRSKGDYETTLFEDSPTYVSEKIVPFINALRLRATSLVLTPGQINIHSYPPPGTHGHFLLSCKRINFKMGNAALATNFLLWQRPASRQIEDGQQSLPRLR